MNSRSEMIIDLTICSGCLAASSAQGHTEILQEVLNEMSGKSFTAQDPDDGITQASRLCAQSIQHGQLLHNNEV